MWYNRITERERKILNTRKGKNMRVVIVKASDNEWYKIEITTEETFCYLLQRLQKCFCHSLIVKFEPLDEPEWYNLTPEMEIDAKITIYDDYLE